MSAKTDGGNDHGTGVLVYPGYPGYDIWDGGIWHRGDGADAVRDEQMAVTSRRIRSLYDSGHPFFTKAALQDLYQQLKSAVGLGETVRVTGLDGAFVEFEVQTGRSLPIRHCDLERVL